MVEIKMPSLGADMEAGTLVQWLVKPGAIVKRGDVIAVVETQKGAIEIECFEEGVFERGLVEVGAVVPVGASLALIGEGAGHGEALPVESALPAGLPAIVPVPPKAEAGAAAIRRDVPLLRPRLNRRVTPVARRVAEENDLDLSAIEGSGPSGEIHLHDVEAASQFHQDRGRTGSEPSQPGDVGGAMSPMRSAIAAAMSRSKQEIPHYYLGHTMDLMAAEAWLTIHNRGRTPDERLLMSVLFIRAVALAVQAYPEFNGHFVDGMFKASVAVHVGIAINVRGAGLVAPAVHDVLSLKPPSLMMAVRDLVGRVRAGRFRASELSDPTITISSLGDRGVETLYGVIYPPQVAIVGFGTPTLSVRAVDGLIGVRKIVQATLAADHRVSDGHRGALFLRHVGQLLEEPDRL